MFGKVINALVTPFDEQQQIDYACVDLLIKQAEEVGNDSLVIGSTTGEGASLSLNERLELYRFCKEHSKLKCLYAICHHNLIDAKKEIELALELKPDGFLIVTPFYVKAPQSGMLLYFKELAKTAKKTPIILYNVPSRTGVSLHFETIKKLLRSQKNIIGLKEASNDFSLIYLLKKNFPDFKVYIGDDRYIYECLKYQGDGIISVSSIIYGKEFQELISDYELGFNNLLLKDYLKLIAEVLSIETNPIPIKYLLERKGFPSMNLRLPLVKLEKTQAHKVDFLID